METENKDLYSLSEKKIKEINFSLWEKISSLEVDASFREKFYMLEKMIHKVPICECGARVKFIDMSSGFRRFCSRKCMYSSKILKEEKINTCLEKWGVDNPSKSDEVKKRVLETNRERFGTDWATQSDETKEKMKKSFIDNLGVDNPSKIPEIREKAYKTMVEKYGVQHAMHSDGIQEKVRNIFIEKLGVDNPSKIADIREKARSTTIERYGKEYALQNPDILNKMKATNMERWGVEYVLQNQDIIDKMKATNMERWGVEIASKSDVIRQKIKDTIISKYGTTNLNEIDDIKEKIKESNIKRFGSEHYNRSTDGRSRFNIGTDDFYIRYIGDGNSEFKCDLDCDHLFTISSDNYSHRKKSMIPLCTICHPIGDSKSIKEIDFGNYIRSIYPGEIVLSYRDKYEIDVLLPDLGIGFEFNGLYWHSEDKKERGYHLEKTLYFEKRGIRIIHIWEDDWTYKKYIMMSQIRNWIGVLNERIGARKCKVVKIKDKSVLRDFLDANHIQGYVNSDIALGLVNDGDLVSIMAFDKLEGRKRMSDGEWNINRFCTKKDMVIPGSASKLIKHFISEMDPIRIISYADRCWSNGGVYKSLGFHIKSTSRPDYKYIKDGRRVHKSRYKSSNIPGPTTESQYVNENNILRIWDCGKIKFELLIK